LAVRAGDAREDAWYSAVPGRLDISRGEATELLRSDVQLGLPAGTSDGTRAAVVEAVCSDRWIVAGDLIVLDLAAGTRAAGDTAGNDVTAGPWICGGRRGGNGPPPPVRRGRGAAAAAGPPAGGDAPHGTATPP